MFAGSALLLGIDLGTTATKAAIYRLDGVLVSEARVDVTMHHPAPGEVVQDMDDFYRSAAAATRACIAASGVDATRIAALAFDSQMAGVGAIDERFRPATHFDSWLDMRCQPYIEMLNAAHRDRITDLTGCPPTCAHGPKMLWWQHERPDDYRRIAKFVMPVSYVAGRMAGLDASDAFIDYTFLHFTGCGDARQGTWSEELCDALGMDKSRLPRIVEPWTVVGEVGADAAHDFGLPAGVPIAAGAGDTAAGALGAGVVKSGMLLDTAGTAAVLAACTASYCADTAYGALMVMRSVVPGLWTPLAYIAGGGMALAWFRENIARQGSAAEFDNSYEQTFAEIKNVPAGCDGLLFSPHVGGRICPAAPQMRGAFVGFSWAHTQAHFLRAVAESVAYEYAWYLRILRELVADVEFTEARVIGGGARSHVWNSIKASVLNVPYRRMLRAESATWGCALIAAKAVGLVDDLAGAALSAAPAEGNVTVPDRDDRAAYDAALARYLDWQQRLEVGFEETCTKQHASA
jgi:xylulokinase